jgi:protein-S-isoprenylcysteine O-methyltransferase Ste14
LAAAPLVFFYAASAWQIAPALLRDLARINVHSIDALFAVSLLREIASIGFVLLALTFLLIRCRPKARSKGWLPRFAAIAGTYLGVAVVWLPPQPIGVVVSLVSITLIVGGLAFSIYALLHLGRSFSLMAEARNLITDGPYARIRHPLYLGEALSMVGLMLQYISPLAVLVVCVQLGFQLLRMKNEELILSSMYPEYEPYRLRTARLLPGVY